MLPPDARNAAVLVRQQAARKIIHHPAAPIAHADICFMQ
jgi:hypothetical protein